MTKIEWCNETINIVWGCKKIPCEYCYAKIMANRIGEYIGKQKKYSAEIIHKMKNFIPVLFPDWNEIFDKKCKGKPKRIFVNSMSDICYWKPEWIERVLNKIKEYPQHTFLFLTKDIDWFYKDIMFLPEENRKNENLFSENSCEHHKVRNCFFGITVNNNNQAEYYYRKMQEYPKGFKQFLSIEPIQEKINPVFCSYCDWIIIGAETGNRKDKIIPQSEWIEEIREYCQSNSIPYFEKGSLSNIVKRNLIQEFPNGSNNIKNK